MKRKRFLASIAILTMLALAATLTVPGIVGTSMAAAPALVKVMVNGVELQDEMPPVIINGYTMVPMRAIFEALGAEVVWDPNMAMVGAKKGDTLVKLRINSKEAWIGMKMVKLDIAPMIVDMHTMVPARFIAQSLGEKVEWDGVNRVVYIGSKTPLPKEPQEEPYVKEITLQANTSLAYNQGMETVFKAGSIVTMRNKNYVKSGTLAEDCFLYYKEGKSPARFLGGSEVSFNDKGYVESATLAVNTPLEYAPIDNVKLDLIPTKQRNSLVFKAHTPITFNLQGYVVEGELVEDAILQYSDNKITFFKGDTRVIFGANGQVRQGVLKEPAYLPYSSNKNLNFKEGLPIEFDENGLVVKGTIRSDVKLPVKYRQGAEVEFKKDTEVSFKDGYVQRGVLTKATALPYREGITVQFKKETEVVFKDDGFVSYGTLDSSTSLTLSNGSYQDFSAGIVINFDAAGYVIP